MTENLPDQALPVFVEPDARSFTLISVRLWNTKEGYRFCFLSHL